MRDDRIEATVEAAGEKEVESVVIVRNENGRKIGERGVRRIALRLELRRDIGRHHAQLMPVHRELRTKTGNCRRAATRTHIAGAHLVRDRPARLIARGNDLELAHRGDALVDEAAGHEAVETQRRHLRNDEQEQHGARAGQHQSKLTLRSTRGSDWPDATGRRATRSEKRTCNPIVPMTTRRDRSTHPQARPL